jgi:DNA-binding transcriptional MerR regulator
MSASRIRYYEARGLIVEPDRVSGRRRYAPDVCSIFTAVDFNPG